MRTKIICRLFFGAFLLFITASAFAQDTPVNKTLPPVIVTATNKKIPEKVWANFRSYFGNAENTKWYEENKNYLVKFMTNEEANRALFTKRGRLIYHISYGYENNLPEELRTQIKGSYNDYSITKAIKVTEANRLIWVVNLETEKKFVMVRLEEGEMEEVQNFNKT
jgi:hypothetical protein